MLDLAIDFCRKAAVGLTQYSEGLGVIGAVSGAIFAVFRPAESATVKLRSILELGVAGAAIVAAIMIVLASFFPEVSPHITGVRIYSAVSAVALLFLACLAFKN